MKLSFILVLCLALASSLPVDEEIKKIRCVGIEPLYFVDVGGDIRTCFLDNSVGITSLGFVVESNVSSSADVKAMNSTQGLFMYGNDKNLYLPFRVSTVLPNLIDYNAGNCQIKEIAKPDFVNLNKLTRLVLSNNQIKKIDGNTFEGLVSLKKLYLNSNKITSIDGKALYGLNSLEKVYLGNNVCSPDFEYNFLDKGAVSGMILTISDKCNGTVTSLSYEP